ncbi:MAG: site-specific integrase, partial [Blastocatellia bacterium]
ALEIAKQQGWIIRNPFNQGDALISIACEQKRERILTKEEETSLLEACLGARSHLRPILICALDTGMRQGEIFKLRWRDVNFYSKLITVEALNTKTLKQREIAMTRRLERELLTLYQSSFASLDSLVFGIETNCKKAFNTLRNQVGLKDVRFHDLRHTAATRMIQAGIPLPEVGRILGHTQANTTYRYVNANADTARRVAMALDSFHLEKEKDSMEQIN